MQAFDPIVAIVTAPGRAAIAVIRVSGQEAIPKVARIFSHGRALKEAASHTVHYGWIQDPSTDEAIDEVLVLLMRGPRSYTGEDVVEIQCHGGSVAATEILALLIRQGVRLAEAGEFTRRAFLNGKVDLTRAEAVMDMVDAQTDEALALAAKQKQGQLEETISRLRHDLMEMIAYIQADLDYPEDDIERLSLAQYQVKASALQRDMEALLAGAKRGQLYREGLKVVIAGRPNVGKSSLLNALTGRQRAIVTDIPGTTRDIVRDHISIDGLPLEILDTAGLRETQDKVESIGVDLAREAIQDADLILLVLDACQSPGEAEVHESDFADLGIPVLPIYNKADLLSSPDLPGLTVSAKTGQGLEDLGQAIFDSLLGHDHGAPRPLISNRRHIALVEKALDEVKAFQEALALGLSMDLLVIHLQVAWEDLGRITGQSAGDDLLDAIFSRFCLGK